MRKIIFRGKRTDNNKWVSGHHASYFPREGKDVIIQPDIFGEYGGFLYFEVDPATVGQFTGIYDKDGKRIFEGDILDCGDRIVVAEWNRRAGTWDSRFVRYTQVNPGHGGVSPADWKYRALVIGNIHDGERITDV